MLEKFKNYMIISPSIASSSLLDLREEIDFVDKYFDNMHIDIEDGNAVHSISFGFKMMNRILDYSKSKEITVHLELINPLNYIEEIKNCDVDVIFIQVDCLDDPLFVLNKLRSEGINVGVNISNLDIDRDVYSELISFSDYILVNTTHHDDRKQICDSKMVDIAIELANSGKNVWIDGGITSDIYKTLKGSNIYAAVMGRAVFENKNNAVKELLNE